MRLSLFVILSLGFLLRLLISPHFTYQLDLNTYLAWSNSIIEIGIKNFFVGNWVDYLPGYPLVLWLLAVIKNFFLITSPVLITTLYKLPAILADIATGFFIYKLLERHKKTRILASAAYLLNPAIFANSALWGQTDSFTALFSLLAFYFMTKTKPALSGLSLGLGALIKLNTLMIAPIIAIGFLKKPKSLKNLFLLSFTAAIIFISGFIPFHSKGNLLNFVQQRVSITVNQYQFTSLNAFNSWFLLDGGSWKSDQAELAEVSKHLWGNIIFLSVLVWYSYKLYSQKKFQTRHYLAAAAAIFITAFLFLTRMHERHLLAAFPFILLWAATVPKIWTYYLWFSLAYFVNLLFGFQQGPGNQTAINVSTSLAKVISSLNLLALFSLFAVGLGKTKQLKTKVFGKLALNTLSIEKKLLIILLFVSLSLRLFRLAIPENFNFDEVYHAFTAREMLRGNIQAWEWWNEPPQGVAYEWTHPPMAKHFMVLGMQIFGQNAFGWRFFSTIFGVGNILLVYLLAQKLFSKRKLGARRYKLEAIPLLAAGLYSVESLSFVQSRIAMNDTYMIFFVLLSLISLLYKNHNASALSFALAIATKWSSIYLAPVLAVAYIATHQLRRLTPPFTFQVVWRLKLKFFLILATRYLLFAIVVYLISYLPFFVSGHTTSQFVELQRQMYWYHTNLQASHDYSSPWWSWPLLLRPVWYHVDYGTQNLVANIYALGNPAIFWAGLLAVLFSIYSLIKSYFKRFAISYRQLAILLAGYASFLLPWAIAPRIMFLYHYLPSIPFMTILLAWALTKIYSSSNFGKKFTISYLLLAISVFIFFYPHLTLLHVDSSWSNLFIWFPSWK